MRVYDLLMPKRVLLGMRKREMPLRNFCETLPEILFSARAGSRM